MVFLEVPRLRVATRQNESPLHPESDGHSGWSRSRSFWNRLIYKVNFHVKKTFYFSIFCSRNSNNHYRYWDCCKPSCAWPGKAAVNNPPFTCDVKDNPLSNYEAVSGCESGGTAFTCTNQAPWAANSLVSYGFAATAISGGTEASWCCACYALTFTSGKAKGKVMLVQSVNTGGDLSGNQFDLQIPGGGTGIFDGCTTEFGSSWGAQYGGISNRSECSTLPTKLQAGCDWRFDWFRNADNPTHTFTQISCPAELTGVTGCVRDDDASFPKYVMPSPATWTVPTPTATAAAYAQCDSLTWDVAMLVSTFENASLPLLASTPLEFRSMKPAIVRAVTGDALNWNIPGLRIALTDTVPLRILL